MHDSSKKQEELDRTDGLFHGLRPSDMKIENDDDDDDAPDNYEQHIYSLLFPLKHSLWCIPPSSSEYSDRFTLCSHEKKLVFRVSVFVSVYDSGTARLSTVRFLQVANIGLSDMDLRLTLNQLHSTVNIGLSLIHSPTSAT